jgi:hypothetical protein
MCNKKARKRMGPRLINYVQANGLAEKFDALEVSTGRQVKEHDNFLRSHTVLEMSEYMNSDSEASPTKL